MIGSTFRKAGLLMRRSRSGPFTSMEKLWIAEASNLLLRSTTTT